MGNPIIRPEGPIESEVDLSSLKKIPPGNYVLSYDKMKVENPRTGKFISFGAFVLENLPGYVDKEAQGVQRFRFQHKELLTFKYDDFVFAGRKLSCYIKYENFDEEGKVIALRSYLDESEILGQELEVTFNPPIGPVIRPNSMRIEDRLFNFSRSTGYRTVKKLMALAKISGAGAMPKGLRHSYGIACAEKNITPRLAQKWMGHASLNTIMIYMDAVGIEERNFAKRLWQ